MGRLIDADIFYDNIVEGTDLGAEDNVDEALKRYLDLEPTVEAIPKADYETRLKADMVANLKELWEEINEYQILSYPRIESLDLYIEKRRVWSAFDSMVQAFGGELEDYEEENDNSVSGHNE